MAADGAWPSMAGPVWLRIVETSAYYEPESPRMFKQKKPRSPENSTDFRPVWTNSSSRSQETLTFETPPLPMARQFQRLLTSFPAGGKKKTGPKPGLFRYGRSLLLPDSVEFHGVDCGDGLRIALIARSGPGTVHGVGFFQCSGTCPGEGHVVSLPDWQVEFGLHNRI
jgi:hypothetical protein